MKMLKTLYGKRGSCKMCFFEVIKLKAAKEIEKKQCFKKTKLNLSALKKVFLNGKATDEKGESFTEGPSIIFYT